MNHPDVWQGEDNFQVEGYKQNKMKQKTNSQMKQKSFTLGLPQFHLKPSWNLLECSLIVELFNAT